MLCELMQVCKAQQVAQYLVPIDFQVLVNQNVAETGNGSETMCKVGGKHFRFPNICIAP